MDRSHMNALPLWGEGCSLYTENWDHCYKPQVNGAYCHDESKESGCDLVIDDPESGENQGGKVQSFLYSHLQDEIEINYPHF